jgi:hypothetical protein
MTKGLITPATEGQEKQLKRVIEDTFERARKKVVLDKDAIQRLLANGDKLQDDVVASLVKHSASDDRFGLLASFKLTVPKGYDHGTQLATFASFAKDKPEKFYYYNDNITDKNFAKVTNKLIPGKTYGVKIFGIKKGKVVSSPDCMAFLASQRAILVGAQGVSLTRQLKKEEFPVGKWTVSFDEKDALWADDVGSHRVPRVRRDSDGAWGFDLGYFGGGWRVDYCLLCFCDLSA